MFNRAACRDALNSFAFAQFCAGIGRNDIMFSPVLFCNQHFAADCVLNCCCHDMEASFPNAYSFIVLKYILCVHIVVLKAIILILVVCALLV